MEEFDDSLLEILKKAKEDGAEEIYLEPGFPVAYRSKDGLKPICSNPLNPMSINKFVASLAGPKNRQLMFDNGSVNFSKSVPGVSRYFVSIALQRSTPYIVIKRIRNADEGGLVELDEIAKQICMAKEGLIIVCGKRGSGRSTLGISLVDYIVHNRNTAIVTLESPIQTILRHDKSIINQREKYTDYQNIEEALVNIRKENPGVVFVDDSESDNVIYESCILSMGRLVILSVFGDDAEKIKKHISNIHETKNSFWTNSYLGILVTKKDENNILTYDLVK